MKYKHIATLYGVGDKTNPNLLRAIKELDKHFHLVRQGMSMLVCVEDKE